jgi:hypothetical protein
VRDIEGGKLVVVAATSLEIVTEAAAQRMFGDGMPDPSGRATYMAALGLRTTSLARATAVLKKNGVPFTEGPSGSVQVPAQAAFNATLTFAE